MKVLFIHSIYLQFTIKLGRVQTSTSTLLLNLNFYTLGIELLYHSDSERATVHNLSFHRGPPFNFTNLFLNLQFYKSVRGGTHCLWTL